MLEQGYILNRTGSNVDLDSDSLALFAHSQFLCHVGPFLVILPIAGMTDEGPQEADEVRAGIEEVEAVVETVVPDSPSTFIWSQRPINDPLCVGACLV